MKQEFKRYDDAPQGKCWKCPDCPSWATLGDNAGWHRFSMKHGDPQIADIPATGGFEAPQKKGGHARAASMTPAERSACASKAARARWNRSGPDGLPTLDGAKPTRPPKCALCHRAHASHERGTLACPVKDGEGFGADTYLSPDLLPKTKRGMLEAYALALDAIATMQGEAMAWKWKKWSQEKPAVGDLIIYAIFSGGRWLPVLGQVHPEMVANDGLSRRTIWFRVPIFPE